MASLKLTDWKRRMVLVPVAGFLELPPLLQGGTVANSANAGVLTVRLSLDRYCVKLKGISFEVAIH